MVEINERAKIKTKANELAAMNSIWVCEHHNQHFGVLGLTDRVVAQLANRGLVRVDMHLSCVAVAVGMEIYGFEGFAASIVIRFFFFYYYLICGYENVMDLRGFVFI